MEHCDRPVLLELRCGGAPVAANADVGRQFQYDNRLLSIVLSDRDERARSVCSRRRSSRALARRSSSLKKRRPAANLASSGLKGERPPAIRSAFMKWITLASLGRNSRANVVLPAAFGPAIMMHDGFFVDALAIHKSSIDVILQNVSAHSNDPGWSDKHQSGNRHQMEGANDEVLTLIDKNTLLTEPGPRLTGNVSRIPIGTWGRA